MKLITLPSSKSMLARQLILAMHAKTKTVIKANSNCVDILTLINCLQNIGFEVKAEKQTISVQKKKNIDIAKLYIEDSGTAFRFLLCYCAFNQKAEITISKQLQGRPINILVTALQATGCKITPIKNGYKISKLASQNFCQISGQESSQYISGLLLANAGKNFTVELSANKIVSKPYLSLTIQMLKSCGIIIKEESQKITLKQSAINIPNNYKCEPDFSSACYFWALGALSNNYVGIKTDLQSSFQADYKFYDLLLKMGAIGKKTNEYMAVKKGELKGINVDMKNMPDQVMTLAVLAIFAQNETNTSNIEHLKYKESDRITALLTELTKIGVDISYKNNILSIKPCLKIKPARLNTYNDHRFVMAFTLLKTLAPQISIDASDSVKKSYPNFITDWALVL